MPQCQTFHAAAAAAVTRTSSAYVIDTSYRHIPSSQSEAIQRHLELSIKLWLRLSACR